MAPCQKQIVDQMRPTATQVNKDKFSNDKKVLSLSLFLSLKSQGGNSPTLAPSVAVSELSPRNALCLEFLSHPL